MKRVENSDINIKLPSGLVYINNFDAKFYTVNAKSFYITKTQNDVYPIEHDDVIEYYIKLEWGELVTIGEGVLQYQIVNNIPDYDRADGYYNKAFERTTEYYINSNVTVDEEEAESYAEIISEISDKLDEEIARSTSADTDFNEQSETISAALNDLNVNKLDATAYTPTDLTNYYTKSEVYNKSEIDNNISGKLNISDFNAYSADTEILINGKQDTLVSGTNIKTINNQSLLGSGNLTIEGGGFIKVTNPITAATKVGLVNSLSQYYDTNIGNGAVIEGDGFEYNGTTHNIVASGQYSHAEGYITSATSLSSHAEGMYTKAFGTYSHAEGYSTMASGSSSHAEGSGTKAISDNSHAEGLNTTASGVYSHAEGYNTNATKDTAHAEGTYTVATGSCSHAEGYSTTASGYASHAEGYNTNASGEHSHAEGNNTSASAKRSHAEGQNTTASGNYSHAEGQNTTASGNNSHAEGNNTTASGFYTHAEGNYTIASGSYTHAEGNNTQASGACSHAEGQQTVASGKYSHAEGFNTITNNESEHGSGQYNISNKASTTFGDSGNTLFSVGNGTASNTRHNAFEIRQNGDIYLTKNGQDVKLQDHLGGGGGSSYTAGDGIDITNDIISVTGKVDTSAITTSVTSSSTDSQVPSAKAVNDKLGGLSIVKLTESEYTALTKDSNTLYVVVPDPSN